MRHEQPEPWRCPEALTHGPPDGAGKCPFCKRKIAEARRYETGTTHGQRTELAEAYGYFYDPDDGTKGAIERQRDLRAGRIWI